MISKLLLTAAVIAGFLLYLRFSGSGNEQDGGETEKPARPPREESTAQGLRIVVIILVVFMILGSAAYLYFEWQDRYRVVSVRVVDTRSGQSVSYEARRGDIGERSFVTLDGLRVTPAATERVELDVSGGYSP